MIKYSNGYLEEYRDRIASGEIVAGQELKQELDRLISDLEDDRYIYDCKEADGRINFIENCVRLTKSPFYGKPMKLLLFQKAFISACYGFKMADGTNRFRRILLLISRKNGKSELCSALALSELILGDEGSDIVLSSNDDMQADILFQATDTMRLMIDPEQKDTWRNQKGIKCMINGSKVYKMSDRTRNKEGRNINQAIVDEVHEMKDNAIVKAIEQSQSLKPNPKLILITTEGFVNGGFLDAELEKARAILNGEDLSISAERYLPWLYTQDNEREVWEDERTWMKSNPSVGIVKRWDYLREQVDAARRSKPDRIYTLSKDFNFKVADSESWLMSDLLEYGGVYNLEDFRGSMVLGGVDLAETTDMTAAKVLMMKPGDKTKYILSMYWIPESKLEVADDSDSGARYPEWAREGFVRVVEGNEVDVAHVADWFFELYKDYGLRLFKCGYDQRFAKEFKKRMDDYGFEYEMILQNRFVLSSPMRLVEADLKDRLINYNENPVDRWCLENTSVQVWDTGHIMPVKIKGKPERKIDGTAALLNAYEIFRRYRSDFRNAIGE